MPSHPTRDVDRHVVPPGTVREALLAAMPPGVWMDRYEVLALVDTSEWPPSRVHHVHEHLHQLVGDGAAERSQLDNGQWRWKRITPAS